LEIMTILALYLAASLLSALIIAPGMGDKK
jgi:hypothetical protein